MRNCPLKYIDHTGKDLVIVVNGNSYKASISNGSVTLHGNDSSGVLVKATEAVLTRFASKFGTEVSGLINAKEFTATILVGEDTTRPGSTFSNSDNEGNIISTTSQVGISGNNDESLVNSGTEILVADEMRVKNDPYLQTSQYPPTQDDPRAALHMSSDFGGQDGAITARERLSQDKENLVRKRFNLQVNEHIRSRYDVKLDSEPIEGAPITERQSSGGTGGLTIPVQPPSPPLQPPPPPRPRP